MPQQELFTPPRVIYTTHKVFIAILRANHKVNNAILLFIIL